MARWQPWRIRHGQGCQGLYAECLSFLLQDMSTMDCFQCVPLAFLLGHTDTRVEWTRVEAGLGNSPATPWNVNHRVTMWPSGSTPRCVPMGNENISSHKNLYINVSSSIVHNSPEVETAQPSISGWIDKQNSLSKAIQHWKEMKCQYTLQHESPLQTLC